MELRLKSRWSTIVWLCVSWALLAQSQWPKDSDKYAQVMDANQALLQAQLNSNPTVEHIIDPSKSLIYADNYFFIDPDNEDYRIGILVDPVSQSSLFFLMIMSCSVGGTAMIVV